MGRSPCCDKVGVKKGPWTVDEDQKLLAYIEEHGHGSWRSLPLNAGLQRCGKSCRLRWTNYLRPDIKRGPFSIQEEQTIIQLHALLGNRWSAIASHLPRRTDNEIKNYWNTHLKKRLTRMGIDPTTHKPRNHDILGLGYGQPNDKDVAKLSHMAQWENARLQAEARLVRESRIAAYRNAQASTSILKPSKNISPVSDVGLSHHESSFVTGKSYPKSAEEEAKGLMENSVGNFHYGTETPNDLFNCFTDFSRFSGCMEGFADLTTEAYSDHIWGSF